MTVAYELLDKKYATREEWGNALDAYQREPVICRNCLHPVDFSADTRTWHHKESVPWCDKMRGEKPIEAAAHSRYVKGNL